MLTEIVELSNTSQLIHSLHLSSISVLLFTAAWSVESQFARDALQNAIPLTPPSCHPYIRLYELPWPPPYPTPLTQRKEGNVKAAALSKSLTDRFPEAFKQLNAMVSGSSVLNDQLVYTNMTKSVPWLPCVQIYLNHSQHINPFVYRDSFDDFSLASFLQTSCDYILSSFTTHQQKEDSVQLNSSGGDEQNKCLDVSDMKSEPTNKLNQSLPTPTSSFHERISPLSRDRFAKLITMDDIEQLQKNEDLCGLLIVVRGGAPVLFDNYAPIWDSLVAAVRHHPSTVLTELTNSIVKDFERSDGTVSTMNKSWITSVIDPQTDSNLIHALELNRQELLSDLSMIIINPSTNNDINVISCINQLQNCSSPQWLNTTLHQSCGYNQNGNQYTDPTNDIDSNSNKESSILVTRRHQERPQHRLLSYVQKPVANRPPFGHLVTQDRQQSYVSLRNWTNYEFTSAQNKPVILWVVAYQPWCGFSQRVLPLYQRFAEIVPTIETEKDVDVDILFIDDCSQFPAWLDQLVDGFPTILMLRQWKHWSSVMEYKEPHRLSQLVDFHVRYAANLPRF